jgi:hypothetical protein
MTLQYQVTKKDYTSAMLAYIKAITLYEPSMFSKILYIVLIVLAALCVLISLMFIFSESALSHKLILLGATAFFTVTAWLSNPNTTRKLYARKRLKNSTFPSGYFGEHTLTLQDDRFTIAYGDTVEERSYAGLYVVQDYPAAVLLANSISFELIPSTAFINNATRTNFVADLSARAAAAVSVPTDVHIVRPARKEAWLSVDFTYTAKEFTDAYTVANMVYLRQAWWRYLLGVAALALSAYAFYSADYVYFSVFVFSGAYMFFMRSKAFARYCAKKQLKNMPQQFKDPASAATFTLCFMDDRVIDYGRLASVALSYANLKFVTQADGQIVLVFKNMLLAFFPASALSPEQTEQLLKFLREKAGIK